MTSTRRPPPSRADAEALLASLAGVVSAHVVTEATGDITEIHILARAGLHPKQVVRNVESALSAGLGIPVDRRIVSVAQVRGEDPVGGGNGHPLAPAEPGVGRGDAADEGWSEASAGRRADPGPEPHGSAAHPRLQFVRYRSHRQNDRCACEVVLRGPGGEIVGEGSGSDTAGGRSEAAAQGVLAAIRAARPELRIELDGATISSSRGRSFVIVAAHILLDRETVHLAGAAALTRSPEEAAILAALQATNRWSG